MKQTEKKGRSMICKTEARTKRGRVIKATMKVDSQAKDYISIRTEANKDWKESRIHFSSISELRTFKTMIEELEKEYENHKQWLKEN